MRAEHDDAIESIPDWLRESIGNLRRLGRVAGWPGDILVMGRLLAMAEVDDIARPVVDHTRDEGVSACWSSFDPASGALSSVCIFVRRKKVFFARYRNGGRVHIARGLLRKGNAEAIRVLLRWLLGPEVVPHEPGRMFETITVGEEG